MKFTRRTFDKLALAAAAAPLRELLADPKPNSIISGVTISNITYSFKGAGANQADTLLQMVLDTGVNHIELMPPAAENYAGVPATGGRGGGGGGRGGSGGGGARGGSGGARGPGIAAGPGGGLGMGGGACTAEAAAAAIAAAAGGRGGGGGGRAGSGGQGGGGRAGGGGRGQQSPEQLAAAQAAAQALKDWRLSIPMEKFKAFRAMYNDAGVEIFCHKLTPSAGMSDAEFDYFFNVGAALGAKQISLELENANDFTKKLGDFAVKHGMVAAYHAHTQATLTAWDDVLAQSKGNAVNLDTGHYVAGSGQSPIPAIEKYAAMDRIASIHLKDRTTPAHCAQNLAWGQGDTPIVEILNLMRAKKWKFPASIELEYQIPEGSDSVAEIKKCFEYCKKALA